jgi:hypothetical protein
MSTGNGTVPTAAEVAALRVAAWLASADQDKTADSRTANAAWYDYANARDARREATT